MPVRPPRALLRATLPAALLSVSLLTATPPAQAVTPPAQAVTPPAQAVTPPAHAVTPPAHAAASVTRTATAPAGAVEAAAVARAEAPATDAPSRPAPHPHLADTGSPGVVRMGAAAMVFLTAGVFLVAAARHLRGRRAP
ncbi:hypothetical protein [Streptomyces sp. NPDC059788]|uniref:hypothetical protein n=1 Tax=Streptomyces sp. NPDC059788 TaxID=3346948 RepID=UPI003661F89B